MINKNNLVQPDLPKKGKRKRSLIPSFSIRRKSKMNDNIPINTKIDNFDLDEESAKTVMNKMNKSY